MVTKKEFYKIQIPKEDLDKNIPKETDPIEPVEPVSDAKQTSSEEEIETKSDSETISEEEVAEEVAEAEEEVEAEEAPVEEEAVEEAVEEVPEEEVSLEEDEELDEEDYLEEEEEESLDEDDLEENEESDNMTLLKVKLVTGRTHQIRIHLSSHNHPIIGDSKYGDFEFNKMIKKDYHLDHQFLHAYSLTFTKPIGSVKYLEGKTFITPLPKKLNQIKLNHLQE